MTESILLQTPIRQPLKLPDTPLFREAAWVVKELQNAGFDACLVGGAIRDIAMGEVPQDCDIATNAHPKQVQKIFPHTVPVGIQFGTIMVLRKGMQYEVTTFRADGRYEDGRRPTSVSFSQHITDDLERRDLTINGLIYDPIAEEVVDYTRGLEDIERKCIRTIGAPADRFGEDRLRMLRAIRFAARLGFTLDPETADAIRTLAPHLREVSVERIQQEMLKMLQRTPAHSTQLLTETQLLQVVVPALAPYLKDACALVQQLEHNGPWTEASALAALLAPLPHPEIEALLLHLRFSNDLAATVDKILRAQPSLDAFSQMSMADQKRFLRQPHIEDILALGHARIALHKLDPTPLEQARQKLVQWGTEQLSPPRLLTGNDLKQRGYPTGPLYKEILLELEELQLSEQIITQSQADQWLQTEYPLKTT